jgi:UDP-3-O-[3-hydroxymyristoyl] glucosamine N-acyltransferase
MDETRQWRKNAVRFGQLDDMARRLKQLEKDSQA